MLESILREQYDHVLSARDNLFDYCAKVSPADFVKPHHAVGRGGSIRNLLAHNAYTYHFWLGENLFDEQVEYPEYNIYPDLDSIKHLYEKADVYINAFLNRIRGDGNFDFVFRTDSGERRGNALKLFTHLITHEFHHKGQIVSISRAHGYTPIDTDIMR